MVERPKPEICNFKPNILLLFYEVEGRGGGRPSSESDGSDRTDLIAFSYLIMFVSAIYSGVNPVSF